MRSGEGAGCRNPDFWALLVTPLVWCVQDKGSCRVVSPRLRSQRLWVWGRLLTGLETAAPSATAEPGLMDGESKCVRKRKKKNPPQKKPQPRAKLKHFCYSLALICAFSSYQNVPLGLGFPRFTNS